MLFSHVIAFDQTYQNFIFLNYFIFGYSHFWKKKGSFFIDFFAWSPKSLHREVFFFEKFIDQAYFVDENFYGVYLLFKSHLIRNRIYIYFLDENVWIIFMFTNVFRYIVMIVQITIIFTTCQIIIRNLIMDTIVFYIISEINIYMIYWLYHDTFSVDNIISNSIYDSMNLFSMKYFFDLRSYWLFIFEIQKNWNYMINQYRIDLRDKLYLNTFSMTDYNFIEYFWSILHRKIAKYLEYN